MALRRSLPFVLLAACVDPISEGEIESTIIGGTQTTTAEFSTVVGLLQGGNNWFCTGVLVHKDWVLTTASCFEGTAATQVRLDDSNLNDGGGRSINVAAIHKHPQFSISSTTWNHDVALLNLAESVTDRTPTPLRRTALALGSQVTQVGYGVSSNSGNGGGVLRSLSTTTLDCARANDAGITNANLLCFDADDGDGSCYGDGGAPAFIGTGANRAVAGLASGGTDDSCTDGFDLYTAISAELTFIDGLLPSDTPPMDPTEPPPMDPTEPTGTDRDPEDPPDGDDGPPIARGCNTGGDAGGFLALLLACAAVTWSRRHAPCSLRERTRRLPWARSQTASKARRSRWSAS
jgi:uncharacterized protein (TIGR03382 family)